MGIQDNIIWFKAEYTSENFELITVFNNDYSDPFVITKILHEATRPNLLLNNGALVKLTAVNEKYEEVKVIFDHRN